MIVELNPEIIAPAPYQHRQDFSHVPELARSIKQNGQETPIHVYKLDAPQTAVMLNYTPARCLVGRIYADKPIRREYQAKFVLISGESRVRACLMLGVKVLAIIEEKPSDLKMAIGTLSENLNRKNPTPTEEANAYKMIYDILKDQGTPEHEIIPQIAKHTGKIERIITDRLALLDLIEPFQILVNKGSQSNGGINKDHALLIARSVPKSYQLQLYRWFEQNGRYCTHAEIEKQIHHIIKLYNDSLQSSMFSFSTPDTATTTKLIDIQATRPTLNGRSTPSITLDPFSLAETIRQWNKAINQWQNLGHDKTAEAMFNKLEVVKATLTAVIVSPATATGKILDQLSITECTTSKLMRNCHLSANETEQALILLEDYDMIEIKKSGRGKRVKKL